MAICKEIVVPMNGRVYEVISSKEIDSDFYKLIVTSIPVEKPKPVKESKKLAKLFKKAKYNPRFFEELKSMERRQPVLMNRFATF
jgi:hypothetical protein